MSPLEAYFHIRSILEHLNAVVAEQFASLLLEKSVSDKKSICRLLCSHVLSFQAEQEIVVEVDIKSIVRSSIHISDIFR
jgi:hypothetical protein